MKEVLGHLHLDISFIYLDDLIIFTKTYEEHFDRIQSVLQLLRESGFKVWPNKCPFLQEKVKYIGHIVSNDGIEPDPDKIEKSVIGHALLHQKKFDNSLDSSVTTESLLRTYLW